MRTLDIEIAVSKLYGIRQNIIVPNISWGFHGMHEMDLFILKKSGYGVEVEIKISLSDLKADFNKKHNHKSKYVREFYYAFSYENYDKFEPLIPKHAGIITCRKHGDKIIAMIIRKAKINKSAIKLNDIDKMIIMRLGCLRIWKLKEKLSKL